MKPVSGSSCGLVCAAGEDGGYVALRFTPSAAELVTVRGGVESVHASQPGSLKPGDWHAIQVDVGENDVTAWVDGYPLFARSFDFPLHGRWGYGWTARRTCFLTMSPSVREEEGPQAAGKELKASGAVTSDYGMPPVVDTMVHDKIMQSWAAGASFWTRSRRGQPTWNHERFYGDTEVAWTPRAGRVVGLTRLMLHAGDDVESGYSLLLTPAQPSSVDLELRRFKRTVAKKRVALPEGSDRRFSLPCGGAAGRRSGGQEVLFWTDPAPIPSGRLGAFREKGAVAVGELAAATRNLEDYPFTRAPVDWEVGTGEWGRSKPLGLYAPVVLVRRAEPLRASIWHRDRFPGDFSLDFNAALRMDTPFAPIYRHPGDICATICADGRDFSSGYTFIYGGWNNSKTCILRGNKIVAETERFRIPDNLDDFEYDLHKQWYRVTVERNGRDGAAVHRSQPGAGVYGPRPLARRPCGDLDLRQPPHAGAYADPLRPTAAAIQSVASAPGVRRRGA